jgi:hypothetical protein
VGPFRFAVSFVFASVACGPSFQAVYECDVRFEHCYALDEGPASPDAKKECWASWLHGYTYGQPSDRVEYAGTRFSQLSLGPTLPNEESREARPPRHPLTVAPLPTSAFAPPPKLAASATVVAASPLHPPGPELASRAPAQDCSDACSQRWTACREGCDGTSPSFGKAATADAGALAGPLRRSEDLKQRSCDECDRSYRTCVPMCFRDDPAHPPPHGAR